MSKMETRSLPVKLSVDEYTARADELARQIGKFDEVESLRKSNQSDFKSQLELIEGKIKALSRVVRDRTEYREIRVFDQRNDVALTMDVIRDDTGEVVESRPLTKEELQPNLFKIEGAKKKAKGSGEGGEGN